MSKRACRGKKQEGFFRPLWAPDFQPEKTSHEKKEIPHSLFMEKPDPTKKKKASRASKTKGLAIRRE